MEMSELAPLKLESKIEAILFARAEPVQIKKLSELLREEMSIIEDSLSILAEKLQNRGIVLQRNGDSVRLGTHPEAHALIEQIRRDELSKDLSKAGLETLSIILYRGPITRSQIDYIRGVNSTFIIRNLLVRGLIEKLPQGSDGRGYLYQPTFELLGLLGIESVNALPEYDTVKEQVETFTGEINVDQMEQS